MSSHMSPSINSLRISLVDWCGSMNWTFSMNVFMRCAWWCCFDHARIHNTYMYSIYTRRSPTGLCKTGWDKENKAYFSPDKNIPIKICKEHLVLFSSFIFIPSRLSQLSVFDIQQHKNTDNIITSFQSTEGPILEVWCLYPVI